MTDKFSQFLSEKFLYDQSVAMELLVQCGLKEQLFDLAKVSWMEFSAYFCQPPLSFPPPNSTIGRPLLMFSNLTR